MLQRVIVVITILTILVLLAGISCKKDNGSAISADFPDNVLNVESDMSAVILVTDSAAFELGYIVNCTVLESLNGDIYSITQMSDTGDQIFDFILPPVDVPGFFENLSGAEKSTYNVVHLKYGGESVDDLESFSPSPGSGMGDFLPPVLICEDDSFYLITKMFGINENQLAELQSR